MDPDRARELVVRALARLAKHRAEMTPLERANLIGQAAGELAAAAECLGVRYREASAALAAWDGEEPCGCRESYPQTRPGIRNHHPECSLREPL